MLFSKVIGFGVGISPREFYYLKYFLRIATFTLIPFIIYVWMSCALLDYFFTVRCSSERLSNTYKSCNSGSAHCPYSTIPIHSSLWSFVWFLLRFFFFLSVGVFFSKHWRCKTYTIGLDIISYMQIDILVEIFGYILSEIDIR